MKDFRFRKAILRGTCCLAIMMTSAAAGWQQQGSGGEQSDNDRSAVSRRLAAFYARQASELLAAPMPTVNTLDLSVLLLEQAIDLDAENFEYRRQLQRAAKLADQRDIAAAQTEALSRLDPYDESIRVERITDLLERHQGAAERIAAYENLLREENLRRLQPQIASRLAFDLAVLHRRVGNVDAFADWLGRATAIDQTNVAAAAMAAGYFHVLQDDPFAQAELFVNLLMANPADVTTQVTLARHLLDQGAYAGAAKLYRLAIETHDAPGRMAPNDLIVDYALALWGSEQRERALSIIEARQRALDQHVRDLARVEQQNLSPAERAALSAGYPPSIHVVLMAMQDRQGELTEESIDAFAQRLDEIIKASAAQAEGAADAAAEARLELLLMEAWVRLWLTAATDQVEAILAEAETIKPLTDETKARFEGWLALRRGDLDAAQAALDRAAADDAVANLCSALILEARGDALEAGRALLAISRDAAGTALGLWARDRAAELGSRTIAQTETARRLNALIDSLPSLIFQVGDDPSRVVSVRIRPMKERFGPFEPVMVAIELRNHASFPIGIGEHGPIRPALIIEPRVTIAGQPSIDAVAPIVIDLDRRLRLEGLEGVEIPVDLRRTTMGNVLAAAIVRGATVELKVTLNPLVNVRGAVVPGEMGSARRSGLFRIDGVTLDAAWIAAALERISMIGQEGDVAAVAVLTHAIATHGADPELGDALDGAIAPVGEAFARLAPQEQAWIISLTPTRAEALNPLRQLARSIEDPLVQLTFLVAQVSEDTDPAVEAALRSEDPRLRRAGELFVAFREDLRRMQSDPNAQRTAPETDDQVQDADVDDGSSR